MQAEQAKSGNFVQKLNNSMSAGKKEKGSTTLKMEKKKKTLLPSFNCNLLNKFVKDKKQPYFLHSIVTCSTNLKGKIKAAFHFFNCRLLYGSSSHAYKLQRALMQSSSFPTKVCKVSQFDHIKLHESSFLFIPLQIILTFAFGCTYNVVLSLYHPFSLWICSG